MSWGLVLGDVPATALWPRNVERHLVDFSVTDAGTTRRLYTTLDPTAADVIIILAPGQNSPVGGINITGVGSNWLDYTDRNFGPIKYECTAEIMLVKL